MALEGSEVSLKHPHRIDTNTQACTRASDSLTKPPSPGGFNLLGNLNMDEQQ